MKSGAAAALRRTDRLLVWPSFAFYFAIGISFIATDLLGFGNIFSVFNFFLLAATIAIIAISASIATAIYRRPLNCFSILLSFIVVIVFWKPILFADNYLHIWLTVNYGVDEQGLPDRQGNGSLTLYNWSESPTASETFLIYDIRDKIADAQLLQGQIHSIYEECHGRTKHLIGHYYECFLY